MVPLPALRHRNTQRAARYHKLHRVSSSLHPKLGKFYLNQVLRVGAEALNRTILTQNLTSARFKQSSEWGGRERILLIASHEKEPVLRLSEMNYRWRTLPQDDIVIKEKHLFSLWYTRSQRLVNWKNILCKAKKEVVFKRLSYLIISAGALDSVFLLDILCWLICWVCLMKRIC